MRKILYSPGYGAGWSSWCSSGKLEHVKFMLEDLVLVELVETGKMSEETFLARWEEVFPGEKPPYLGGMDTLEVMNVDGLYRITEYHGYEGVETTDDLDWM